MKVKDQRKKGNIKVQITLYVACALIRRDTTRNTTEKSFARSVTLTPLLFARHVSGQRQRHSIYEQHYNS